MPVTSTALRTATALVVSSMMLNLRRHCQPTAQTIDPWPPYVNNRRLTLDGSRAGLAMQRYQTNRVLRPRPLNPEKAAETQQPDNALQAPTPQQ